MKLTLNNLNKCYKDKAAVKDIFEANHGETIGILGQWSRKNHSILYDCWFN